MKKLTQPLKIFGGKGASNGKLAKWIISMMPPRDTWNLFSESHFGGGAVSLAMNPEGISEIHNDIHGELMNFWVTLQGKQTFACFHELCEKTPLAQCEWKKARCKLADGGQHSSVLRAWWFFILCRQSRAGQMTDFVTPTARTRWGMNEHVSAWLNAIDGLPEVHARVKRMEFCCMDGTEFIRKFDHPRRLYYIDPTYMRETRTAKNVYQHEMTDDQHVELLSCLAGIKGRFMLSGYRSGYYDEWSDAHSWHRRDFEIANCASGAKQKPKMTECLWMNYEPPEATS